MSGGQNAAIKDQAWALGKDLTADIDAWMNDKWGLSFAVKLNAIAYDARNNTNTLVRYNAAETEMLRLNEILMNKKIPKKGGYLADSYMVRLKDLISRANVALPQGMDITDGPSLFDARAVGERKLFVKSQQKTYRSILDHVAALIEYTNSIYLNGIISFDGKQKDKNYSSIIALEENDFMKTMRGYSQGICHVTIYNNLCSKINMIKHTDAFD